MRRPTWVTMRVAMFITCWSSRKVTSVSSSLPLRSTKTWRGPLTMMSVIGLVGEQRLERAEAQHVVEQKADQLFLLRAVEAQLALGEDFGDQAGQLAAELVAREAGRGRDVDALDDDRLDFQECLLDAAPAGADLVNRIAAGRADSHRGLAGGRSTCRVARRLLVGQPGDQLLDDLAAIPQAELGVHEVSLLGDDHADLHDQLRARQLGNRLPLEGTLNRRPHPVDGRARRYAQLGRNRGFRRRRRGSDCHVLIILCSTSQRAPSASPLSALLR